MKLRHFFIGTLLALFAGTLTPSIVHGQRTKPLNPHIDSLFPDQPTSFLTDAAHVVKNPGVVDSLLHSYQQSRLKLNLVAVTLPTIRDYQPYEVAMEIGRKWMIAQKDSIGSGYRNTGAVILLSMKEHKCFIATATGTEGYITDATAGQLCSAQTDYFRAGDFDTGILHIAEGIQARAAADLEAQLHPAPPPKPFNWTPVLYVLGLIGLALIICVPILVKREKERQRKEAIRRAEEEKRMAAQRARQRAEEAERERLAAIARKQAEEKERQRWNALTPAQQAAELAEKKRREEEEKERRRLAAIAAAEEEERRQKRQREEDDRRSSYNSSSDSSSSSGGGFSIGGGSDSFGGGGGGSSW